jgi:hypothetical protein
MAAASELCGKNVLIAAKTLGEDAISDSVYFIGGV